MEFADGLGCLLLPGFPEKQLVGKVRAGRSLVIIGSCVLTRQLRHDHHSLLGIVACIGLPPPQCLTSSSSCQDVLKNSRHWPVSRILYRDIHF